MAWPTPQDYNETIQNPRICFSDPELKQGVPALTPHGLPKVISGAFASVYRLESPGHRWAVRCFLREYADQQLRYSAISDRLRATRLPCMVGFEFLREGIRVAGRWYPILKMEWIDGESLNDHIARNLNNPEALRSLSRRWIDLMASLRKTGIAHGDLQHGNILVSGGDLKLIDYDAMYVPALKGLESHEDGHRNYQHPNRTGKDYHADIDNFSAWVIFTSISALAIDPGLWNLPNAGDECLLFRREDFEKPWTSKALRALESNGNDHLRTLVSHFRSILGLSMAQVPPLDGSILNPPGKPSSGPNQTSRSEAERLPDWLSDHIPQGREIPKLEPLVIEPDEPRASGAEWLYDHLIDDGPPVDRQPIVIPRKDRIAAWCCLVLLGALVPVWSAGIISGLLHIAALAICVTILVKGYQATNTTAQREAIKGRLKAARMAEDQIEYEIDLCLWSYKRSRLGEPLKAIKAAYERLPRSRDVEIDELSRKLASALKNIERRMQAARRNYAAEIQLLDEAAESLELDLAMTLEGIDHRRRDAIAEERSALARHDQRFQSALNQLNQKRGALGSEEQAEVDRMLQKSRTQHVNNALGSIPILASEVHGIGEALVWRLWSAGVTSAREVSYDRVRDVLGIGDAKATALVDWRNRIEQWANRSAPLSLSNFEMCQIQAKYGSLRNAIDQQIATTKAQDRNERQGIDQQYSTTRRDLDGEERAVRSDFEDKRSTLLTWSQMKRDRLTYGLSAFQRALDAEQQSANQDHHQKQKDVTKRFDHERNRLAAEYNAEAARAAEARKKLDARLTELNRALIELRYKIHKLVRELDSLASIGIRQFLGLVLLPNRKH